MNSWNETFQKMNAEKRLKTLDEELSQYVGRFLSEEEALRVRSISEEQSEILKRYPDLY